MVTTRTYGQFCGLARALEMIGERWGLLVIRDLVLGPKRFTDLRSGLPRIPASLLTARLNELEAAGVVRRRILPQLDASVVYELTEYGRDLEGVVMALGVWGARTLGNPCPEDVFTADAAKLSLYATFQPEKATGLDVAFEVRFGPQLVVHAMVEDGNLKVSEGPYAAADLVIDTYAPLVPVLAGRMTAAEALDSGLVGLPDDGDPALFELFSTLFRIPAAPAPAELVPLT